MTAPEIVRAINKIRPGATEWSFSGTDIDSLLWADPVQSKPTKAEILKAIADTSYRDLRAAEYPPIADQLDAVWKGGADLEAMREKIMAVKTKYPKAQ